MPALAVVLIVFFAAAALDLVVIEWHSARAAAARRERGAVARGTVLAMVHDALVFLPMLVALETGGALTVMIASVAGVGVANVIGLRRSRL